MEKKGSPPRALDRLKLAKRRAVSLSQRELIKTDYMTQGQTLPLVIEPAVDGLDLTAWAARNQEFIRGHLLSHGAIVFRGFKMRTALQFEQFIRNVSSGPLEYYERSSPRHNVSGNIYTSTDYPADQTIFLHNENSYQHSWPLRIFFFCVTVAEQGGETLLADCRKVLQRLSPETRERFIEKKVMYVRNFRKGLGLPWQAVFQTTERDVVEQYCRKAGIETEWKGGDWLRTRQRREAVVRHPQTGAMLWFNHAAFFHASTLQPVVRELLLAEYQEEELPSNTYYGDSSPIPPSVVNELREAYHQETLFFRWQEGDILMLDNMLTAHGRAPFVGTREILVGMAEPYSLAQLT